MLLERQKAFVVAVFGLERLAVKVKARAEESRGLTLIEVTRRNSPMMPGTEGNREGMAAANSPIQQVVDFDRVKTFRVMLTAGTAPDFEDRGHSPLLVLCRGWDGSGLHHFPFRFGWH